VYQTNCNMDISKANLAIMHIDALVVTVDLYM